MDKAKKNNWFSGQIRIAIYIYIYIQEYLSGIYFVVGQMCNFTSNLEIIKGVATKKQEVPNSNVLLWCQLLGTTWHVHLLRLSTSSSLIEPVGKENQSQQQ